MYGTYSDKEIIETHKDEFPVPNKSVVSGYFVLRDQLEPHEHRLKYFPKTMASYQGYMHPEIGLFCLLACQTSFSIN